MAVNHEEIGEIVADVLACRFEDPPHPADARLALTVLERIARGEAVEPSALATLAGEADPLDPETRQRRVANLAEQDASGAITGVLGLSLEPTGYRLDTAEGARGTWCALDTLFLPPLLATATSVSSTCAVSGVPVGLRLDAAGVLVGAEPETLHLTVPVIDRVAAPREHAGLRSTFCAHSRFAVDRDAAEGLADPQATAVLSVVEAAALGRDIAAAIRRRAGERLPSD